MELYFSQAVNVFNTNLDSVQYGKVTMKFEASDYASVFPHETKIMTLTQGTQVSGTFFSSFWDANKLVANSQVK